MDVESWSLVVVEGIRAMVRFCELDMSGVGSTKL